MIGFGGDSKGSDLAFLADIPDPGHLVSSERNEAPIVKTGDSLGGSMGEGGQRLGPVELVDG